MSMPIGARPLSRRKFLAWSGAVAGTSALVLSGCGRTASYGRMPTDKGNPLSVDRTVWSACLTDCVSRCPLRLQVKDERVVRVLQDNTGSDEIGNQQIRACVRGRSIRHRMYSPDRLKGPMKRAAGAKRGEDKFVPITWSEAYDTIAAKLKECISKYGNESIFQLYGVGTVGSTFIQSYSPYGGLTQRLFNLVGGSLTFYGDYSLGAMEEASRLMYGEYMTGNSTDDWKNAKLVVLFGYDPVENRMSGGGDVFIAQQTRKKYGTRIICIEPRHSETAANLADQWVPIRPGTDAALVAALSNVLITGNLHDQAFLDKYCVGFDEKTLPAGAPAGSSWKSYVMGQGPDRTAKTPEWAAPITGIPASTIRQLGLEIGSAKPVAIVQGWAPQRQFNGENTSRAIMTLQCMTGQVGIPGGGAGSIEGSYMLPMVNASNDIPNPITTQISHFTWIDAVDHGDQMTALKDGVRGADKLKTSIKFLWAYGSNQLANMNSDVHRTTQILTDESKAEFIVVIDNMHTSSTKYADILLPDVFNTEQMDLAAQGDAGNMGYTILFSPATKPLWDTKPIYEITSEIAKRMGVEKQFTLGRTQEDWIRACVDESRKGIPNLPSFDDLKTMGVWRQKSPDPTGSGYIALADFRADPAANKLTTPSGRIEIYSAEVAQKAKTWQLAEGDRITPLPEWMRTPSDYLSTKEDSKYPLQLINKHFRGETHTNYHNVDFIREAHPMRLWLNPIDADARGLKNDDLVEVFNDNGRTQIQVRVTGRIMPGVACMPHGGWYTPGANGVDTGGCTNVRTTLRPTALAKSNPSYSNLVQVSKA